MTDHIVYLGLGSNLGDRHQILLSACQEIEKLIGPIVRQSAFLESEPWGFCSDNRFLNAVVCCETELSPRALLWTTQQIERSLGRTRKSVDGIYHDRTIDIDILLYDHLTVCAPDLRIPHPLILQRPFVWQPLLEILQ
ncbi:MAG: 2-amino-4-hydroxy-6-hydroxymethyldihydropteridine diphosphokinase [Prevotella sp.]|nr:2-amino-4-hydroxy-6-hydroxymethyldihydropteridine diphosphokinase [Prevotella sp.]